VNIIGEAADIDKDNKTRRRHFNVKKISWNFFVRITDQI
jgi:hypothetical protein